MKKETIIISSVLAALCAAANPSDPQINLLNVEQDPYSRRVTATYTLDESAIVTMDVLTNGVSIGGKNIRFVSGDCNKLIQPTSGAATRTIWWQPNRSWPDQKFTEPVVSIRVTAWATNSPPDYLVVDLADSPDVLRYYPGEGFLPGGLVENAEYRTSKIVMRRILAKDVTFTMGSGSLEPGRNATREKTHSYTLDRDYYIGVFEVTQGQWSRVTNNIAATSQFTLPGDREGRPRAYITYNRIRRNDTNTDTGVMGGNWPDEPYADSFLGLLRKKTNIDFDLPTEAEWEYACRAGTNDEQWNDGTHYSMTDNNTKDEGLPGRYRYNGGYIDGVTAPDFATTAAASGGTDIVGRHAPNLWGLYDMHGNVYEWCVDVWEDDNSGRHSGVNATTSMSDATKFSYRGGAWDKEAAACRTAARSNDSSKTPRANVGFRLVCTAGLQ